MADRRVSVKIDADPGGFVRGMTTAAAATKAFTSQLDTSNERATMLTQSVLALGPSLVPIAAAGVPAVTSLAASLGAAAGAAGVAVLAFNGVGDAIKKVREAELEPTADNLAEMRLALEELGPAGASFAQFLNSLSPQIDALQNAAREGLFPGLEDGITSLLGMGPQVERIISNIAEAMGTLADEAGAGLSGEGFADFFRYIEQDAGPILLEMGRTLGNVTEGIANMLVGFEPLSSQFSGGLLEMSRSFAEWSSTLDSNDGFQAFMAYIERVGPKVAQTFGSLIEMLAAFAQAAAPIGEASLPVIRALADVLAMIADSPVGPTLIATAAGLSAVSRAIAIFNAANASALVGMLGGIAKSGPGASASLVGVARSAGVLAAIVYTGDQIVGGLDAISRHSRTAEASMKNLSEIQLALAGSNLGKHAEKLGIDMQRLAVDLAENGRQGEYVREVYSQLGGQTGTFANLYDSIVPANEALGYLGVSWGVNAQEAAMAGKSLEQLIDNLPTDEIEGTSAAVKNHTDSLRDNTAALQANVDAMKAQRAEALRAADAQLNYEEALLDVRKAAKQNEGVLKNNGDAMKGSRRAAIEAKRELHALAGAWNEQSDAAKNVPGAHKAAIDAFVDAAVQMGMSKQAAREYARELMEIPSERKTKILLDHMQALSGIELVGQKLAALDGRSARTYITTVYSEAGYQTRGGLQEADGGIVSYYANGGLRREQHIAQIAPAGSLRVWAEPETGGEAYIPLAPAKRSRSRSIAEETVRLLGGRGVEWYAEGGINYNLDQRQEMLRLEQTIRELTRSLEKNGKDALGGLNRQIAELDLIGARRDLRQARRAPFVASREATRESIAGLREARGGFDIDADMSVGDVRRELNEFRREVREAGGEWTKRLQNMGDRLLRNAQALNKAERAVERETEKRERLQDGLDDQLRSMEELQRVMDGFASSVAGNFLTDPFNLSYTAPGAPAGMAPIAPDPALIAARDQLGAAESRLAGIRGRTDIDPLTRSYLASKAVAEVAELRSQVEMLDRGAKAIDGLVEPVERTVSGLEAFEEALRTDIDRVTRFGAALDMLAGKGLDTTGPLGGLYSDLARSGDLGLAEELAGLTPEQIAEYEQLFADRGEAVATVAARATQAVYAEQWAAEQKELRAIQGEMKANARAIERQTNVIERRVERLQNINQRGFELVGAQVGSLRDQVQQQAREMETLRQKSSDGGKRGRK